MEPAKGWFEVASPFKGKKTKNQNMSDVLLRIVSVWLTRKGTLRYALIFSLSLLFLAIFIISKQRTRLENEFVKQGQNIELTKAFAQQTSYIEHAETSNSRYALSGDGSMSEVFDATIDSIRVTHVKLSYLENRNESEADRLLFQRGDELIREKIEFMRSVKLLCDGHDRAGALALIAAGKGMRLSDSILAVNNKINFDLEAKLKSSQREFLRVDEKNNMLALCGISCSILLITVVLSLFLKFTGEAGLVNIQLEKKVANRTVQLEAANKELEAFSYSVSHDLRAPLRAISAYSKILKDDYGVLLDDEANKIMRILMESAKSLGLLIDDLLKFSQLGRLDAVRIDVNMNMIVNAVIKEMMLLWLVGKYAVVRHELPSCRGDVNMLKQVWYNLVDNALKYSGKKELPYIEIGCDENPIEFTYFIKDNGVGFDMAYSDRLFGVFQRLHRKDEFDGTGLGLSLVKRIVEKHRGRVYALSELNVGSTFFFTIPK